MPTQTEAPVSSQTGSLRSFAWAWLVYALFIVVLAAKIWIPHGLAARMDFREMYAAGVLMRTDPAHLYDLERQNQVEEERVGSNESLIPFGHMAYEAFLFAPLSLLNYAWAYMAMVALNLLLIALCFLAARAEFSTVVPLWQPRPGWIFFSFLPTSIALALGQDSLLSLLIVCLTWKFLRRSRPFTAGVVLALLLFKPHLAVLLALFLAVQYGWGLVGGFAAGSALLTAICVPFLRHGGLKAWFAVLWGISLASGSNGTQQVAEATYPWSMPNLRGLLFTLLGSRLAPHLFLLLVGAISLAVLAWMLAGVRRLPPRPAFALAILAAVLLSYSFEPSDCVILLIAILLLQGVEGRLLALCRHAILLVPSAVLLFAPPTPPGSGFFLESIPLLVAAFCLSTKALPVTARPRPAQ